MAKVADRPHTITIALSIAAVLVSALGVYINYANKSAREAAPQQSAATQPPPELRPPKEPKQNDSAAGQSPHPKAEARTQAQPSQPSHIPAALRERSPLTRAAEQIAKPDINSTDRKRLISLLSYKGSHWSIRHSAELLAACVLVFDEAIVLDHTRYEVSLGDIDLTSLAVRRPKRLNIPMPTLDGGKVTLGSEGVQAVEYDDPKWRVVKFHLRKGVITATAKDGTITTHQEHEFQVPLAISREIISLLSQLATECR